MRRPLLNIPKTKMEVLHDAASIVILIGTFVYLYWVWPTISDNVPIHFNASGEADRWGSKGLLIVLPIINVILYAGFAILSKYPHVYNYVREITEENAHRQYLNARMLMSWIKLETVALFGYVEWGMIQAASGNEDGLGLWFVPVVIILVLSTVLFYAVRSWRMT